MRPRRHDLHPYLDQPAPIAIAHRGGAEEAPQNTLAAFAAAIALGYRYLETDAHVTRDGIVVAFHDPHLDTITDRTGALAALSISEVEAADAGYHFSPDNGHSFPFRGRGVRIPRLEELLLRWPHAHINIDPKADACLQPLVTVIDRLGAWDRVGFGAFSDRRLRRLRALSHGRACTSMGPRAVAVARTAALLGAMPRQNADCIQVPLRRGPIPIITARFIRAGPSRRPPRSCLDHQRRAAHARPTRPRRGRHHHRPPDTPTRRARRPRTARHPPTTPMKTPNHEHKHRQHPRANHGRAHPTAQRSAGASAAMRLCCVGATPRRPRPPMNAIAREGRSQWNRQRHSRF